MHMQALNDIIATNPTVNAEIYDRKEAHVYTGRLESVKDDPLAAAIRWDSCTLYRKSIPHFHTRNDEQAPLVIDGYDYSKLPPESYDLLHLMRFTR